jgi:hypothetical protein
MPIDWNIADADADVAEEMIALMRELFPLLRQPYGSRRA